MSYSIKRTDLNSITIGIQADSPLAIKLTRLDPITKVEKPVTISIPDTLEYTISDDYYNITASIYTTLPITLSADGVYLIYIEDGETTYKHLVVSTKTTIDYMSETALNNICCCPVRDCKHTVFANKDYIFNVISNLSFTFLGLEFEDVAFDYTETYGDIEQVLFETSEILYRINEYLLSDTSNDCKTC